MSKQSMKLATSGWQTDQFISTKSFHSGFIILNIILPQDGSACFLLLLGLLFHPEDGGDTFIWNGWIYMELHVLHSHCCDVFRYLILSATSLFWKYHSGLYVDRQKKILPQKDASVWYQTSHLPNVRLLPCRCSATHNRIQILGFVLLIRDAKKIELLNVLYTNIKLPTAS